MLAGAVWRISVLSSVGRVVDIVPLRSHDGSLSMLSVLVDQLVHFQQLPCQRFFAILGSAKLHHRCHMTGQESSQVDPVDPNLCLRRICI